MPTIKDIAKLAGVTFVSVSRALNNEPGVSEQTRRKILRIAEELNYVPNVAAKRLVDRSSNGIGLIWTKRSSRFFYDTCNQIQEEAVSRGFTMMVSLAEREEALRSFREYFMNRAICWLEQRPSEQYLEAKRNFRGTILEVGGREGWKQEYAHRLDIDRKGAIRQGMQHLFELGHRRIAFMGGHSDKWLGYTEAIVQLGLEFDPELCVMTLVSNPDMAEKVKRFVHGFRESGTTAVIVDSEGMLRELIKMAYPEGVRIPDDLSIVVYDDLSETESLLNVPITTVGPDSGELARKVLDMITVQAEQAAEGELLQEVLRTQLHVRGTTRPVSLN